MATRTMISQKIGAHGIAKISTTLTKLPPKLEKMGTRALYHVNIGSNLLINSENVFGQEARVQNVGLIFGENVKEIGFASFVASGSKIASLTFNGWETPAFYSYNNNTYPSFANAAVDVPVKIGFVGNIGIAYESTHKSNFSQNRTSVSFLNEFRGGTEGGSPPYDRSPTDVWYRVAVEQEGGIGCTAQVTNKSADDFYQLGAIGENAVSVPLTITAAAGYQLKCLKVNDSNATGATISGLSTNNMSYIMKQSNGSAKIKAIFEPIKYDFTPIVIVNPNGGTGYGSISYKVGGVDVTPGDNGSFEVPHGRDVKLTVTPNVEWTATVSESPSQNGNEYTFSNITSAKSATITWTKVYDVTIPTADGFTISSNLDKVNHGSNYTLTLALKEGYTGTPAITNNGNPVNLAINGSQWSATINATCGQSLAAVQTGVSKIKYDATATAPNATVAFSGNGYSSGKVEYGTQLSITVAPNTGYTVDSYTVSVGSVLKHSGTSNGTYNLQANDVKDNVSVNVVTSATPKFTLTAASANGGTISFAPGGECYKGENITINLTASQGYILKSLKVGSNDVTSNVSSMSYTVSNIQANAIVTAEWESTLKITITNSEGGTIAFANGYGLSKTVNWGESVGVKAIPGEGKRLKTLKVEGTPVTVTDGAYTITDVRASLSVTAEWESAITVTITNSEGGVIAFASGTGLTKTVNKGDSVVLNITPADGKKLKSLKINGAEAITSGKSYTISNIQAGAAVTAEWESAKSIMITIADSEGGKVRLANDLNVMGATVAKGSNVVLKIVADKGYLLKSLSINGTGATASAGNYTINDVQSDVLISASWTKIGGTALETPGGITYASSTKADSDGKIKLTLQPDNGYRVQVKVFDVTKKITGVAFPAEYTVDAPSIDDVSIQYIKQVKLDILPAVKGSVQFEGVSADSITVDQNTKVKLKVEAEPGYKLTALIINNIKTEIDPNMEYTLPVDAEILGMFTPITADKDISPIDKTFGLFTSGGILMFVLGIVVGLLIYFVARRRRELSA